MLLELIKRCRRITIMHTIRKKNFNIDLNWNNDTRFYFNRNKHNFLSNFHKVLFLQKNMTWQHECLNLKCHVFGQIRECSYYGLNTRVWSHYCILHLRLM